MAIPKLGFPDVGRVEADSSRRNVDSINELC
jgi:hypothetical protein